MLGRCTVPNAVNGDGKASTNETSCSSKCQLSTLLQHHCAGLQTAEIIPQCVAWYILPGGVRAAVPIWRSKCMLRDVCLSQCFINLIVKAGLFLGVHRRIANTEIAVVIKHVDAETRPDVFRVYWGHFRYLVHIWFNVIYQAFFLNDSKVRFYVLRQKYVCIGPRPLEVRCDQ